eukprot:gene22809-biopygen1211
MVQRNTSLWLHTSQTTGQDAPRLYRGGGHRYMPGCPPGLLLFGGPANRCPLGLLLFGDPANRCPPGLLLFLGFWSHVPGTCARARAPKFREVPGNRNISRGISRNPQQRKNCPGFVDSALAGRGAGTGTCTCRCAHSDLLHFFGTLDQGRPLGLLFGDWHVPVPAPSVRPALLGEQDSGAGVARAIGIFFLALGGAGVARAFPAPPCMCMCPAADRMRPVPRMKQEAALPIQRNTSRLPKRLKMPGKHPNPSEKQNTISGSSGNAGTSEVKGSPTAMANAHPEIKTTRKKRRLGQQPPG